MLIKILGRVPARWLHHDSKFTNLAPPKRLDNKHIRQTVQNRLLKQVKPIPAHERKFEPFPFAVTEENKTEILRKVVVPLLDTPYEEQLTIKQAHCRDSIRQIAQKLYSLGTPVRLGIDKLPCKINPVIPLEETSKYRNSGDFSVWTGHDRETIVVGYLAFPLGKHGDSVGIEPDGLDILRDEIIETTSILKEFMNTTTQAGTSLDLSKGGWRRFSIKVNKDGDLLVIGQFNPRQLRVKDVIEERTLFKDFVVKKCQDLNMSLKSLYFQACPNNHGRHRKFPYELIHGKDHIVETIGNLKFKHNYETLLPNPEAGEKILTATRNLILDCFEFSKKPTIISLHCDSAFSMMGLADMASKVIGVDLSEENLQLSLENCQLNGVENVTFINGQFEIILERLLENHCEPDSPILLICDLKNGSLPRPLIEAIRKCTRIKKFIINTSRISAPMVGENIVDLCQKKQGSYLENFELISATPVDTNPHTRYCNLLIALEKMSKPGDSDKE